MGNCLWADKPSWCITNTKVNSAFYPFGGGKSSIGLSSWDLDYARSPVLDDPIWQVTLRSFKMGVSRRAVMFAH